MIRLVAASILIAALGSGCGLAGARDRNGDGSVSSGGTIRVVPLAERGPRISLQGKDLDGVPISVPARPGRATVVNVWWSGCSECRAEAPILREASRDLQLPADFAGINIRETGVPQAQRFEDRFGIDYPSFYDPGGRLLLELHHAVPYAAIPTTIVLDQSGRVGAVIVGAVTSERTLRDVVSSVLEGTEGR